MLMIFKELSVLLVNLVIISPPILFVTYNISYILAIIFVILLRILLSFNMCAPKETPILTLLEIYLNMYKNFSNTSLFDSDLLAYSYRFYKMEGMDSATLTLPASGDYLSGTINGQSVILPDLQDTALRFHHFSTPGIETEGLAVPDNSSPLRLLN